LKSSNGYFDQFPNAKRQIFTRRRNYKNGFSIFRKKSLFLTDMNKLKYFVEWHVFGVCTAIGEKMGIATNIIRKYFIYISFLTVGSPLIIYLFVAFWMNIKKYVRISRRNPAGI